jgi:hypothetical protein
MLVYTVTVALKILIIKDQQNGVDGVGVSNSDAVKVKPPHQQPK